MPKHQGNHHQLSSIEDAEVDTLPPEAMAHPNNDGFDTTTRRKHAIKYMRYITAMAAIGGFLLGYDTGVISGAMLPMRRAFDLSSEEQEVVVSSTIFAAFISSLCAGSLNHKMGRKVAILLAAFLFTMGSIFLFFAWNYTVLVCGRVIVGVGIGVVSMTAPVYIAEVAMPEMRGQLVTVNTLMITFGQFFAGIMDGILQMFFPTNGWRFMLGLRALPSLIMFLGFLNLPESPRWLASKGMVDQASEILYSLRETNNKADEELKDIVDTLPNKETVEESTLSYGSDSSESSDNDGERNSNGEDDDSEDFWPRLFEMLSHAPTRKALFLGCGFMVLQQVVGINTVMYYSASIFEMAGFEELTAIWLAGFSALALVASSLASTFLVDRVGRRSLALDSLGPVCISLVGLTASFYLSRISSGPVDLEQSSSPCQAQPAMIWDGITAYCYDCASIPGCGYCNGACVQGSSAGPLPFADEGAGDNSTLEVCLPTTNPKGKSVVSSAWKYDNCPNPYGGMAVFFLTFYLLTFGIGMGAMPWTVNSEIYPLKYRSVAVSFSTATNWISNLVVSATFLSISSPHVLTAYGAFGLYTVLSVLGFCWLYFILPETKGLSLEEIESLFKPSNGKYNGVRSNQRERESLRNKC